MSSIYAGADTYPASPVLPDDGDPASAAGIGRPALETAMDRTTWLRAQMKRPKLHAFGEAGYVMNAGNFALNLNFMSLDSVTTAGDDFRVALRNLVHGAVISSIDVFFVPAGGHAGLPGTAPQAKLARYAVAAAGTPAVPTVIASVTYSPVSLADYNNGKFKQMTISAAHTVDAEGYVYELAVFDESGANSIVGAGYVAYRINYT